jgi:hypothetical protein
MTPSKEIKLFMLVGEDTTDYDHQMFMGCYMVVGTMKILEGICFFTNALKLGYLSILKLKPPFNIKQKKADYEQKIRHLDRMETANRLQ